MSQYLTLEDTDYVPAGTALALPLIIRASAIIDGRCKREIGVTTYTERIPLTNQRGHLSYYPVKEVTAVKGRAAYGITGDNFFGAPEFTEADLSVLDVNKEIGSLLCGGSPFGAPYAELEVTYTSGWDPIPDKVKVACGLIVAQLSGNPDTNVKSKKDFDFSIEYFGNDMITPEIADLLSEYQHRSFR
ncbi:hypothetical protein GCM10010912_17660 [Paenibacillus albidus]|uniref:Uncharacterized protein n=1 Tax=Paenibacillus albidus TaxID=2041023 RepID=A0A917FE76_9BACL|nr:hypothetical protein [Paenibacillus albidus]GGF72926.1 hypothetical protein GCM10010912_17660 [Paenibacillus albidus]